MTREWQNGMAEWQYEMNRTFCHTGYGARGIECLHSTPAIPGMSTPKFFFF